MFGIIAVFATAVLVQPDLVRIIGMSEPDLRAASEGIRALIGGMSSRFEFPVSGSSAAVLVALSVAVWALEAGVGLSHMLESPKLERLRPWTLLIFGFLTYVPVPVVGLAALLALFGSVSTGLQRRWVVAFGVMALLPVVRVLSWVVF